MDKDVQGTLTIPLVCSKINDRPLLIRNKYKMSKWVTISARVPQEKYEEYMKALEYIKDRTSVRNSKGEFTVSVFVTMCIDKFIKAVKKKESK